MCFLFNCCPLNDDLHHQLIPGELLEEEVSDELVIKLEKEPPRPPLDVEQLKALKAELRAAVPGIHEVGLL